MAKNELYLASRGKSRADKATRARVIELFTSRGIYHFNDLEREAPYIVELTNHCLDHDIPFRVSHGASVVGVVEVQRLELP